jgi:gamma-glutamyltranspeptidase/glutathione hydrolase
LNSYFGGVHAIALQKGKWVGSADPRRDGTAGYTMK